MDRETPYLNDTQRAIASALRAHQTHQTELPALVQAGMGVGKTFLAYDAATHWNGMVAYAHPTHALCTQAFSPAPTLRPQDYELAGLSADQICKFTVASQYVSTSRVRKFEEKYGYSLECQAGDMVEDVLERHRFREDLPVSLRALARLIGLRKEPLVHPNEFLAFRADRHACQDKKVVVCTITTLLLDAWTDGQYSGLPYTYAFIDEAHQVYNFAKLLFDRSVCEDDFEWLGGDQKKYQEITKESLDYARKQAKRMANEDHTRAMDLLAAFNVMEKHLDKEGARYFGMKSVGGCWKLEFRNPARILRRLYERIPCAFLSGTLTVTDDLADFARIIGAKDYTGAIYTVPDFGRARFLQVRRMNEDEANRYISAKESGIHVRYKADIDLAALSARHAHSEGKNVLVLTTNTDDTLALGERLGCIHQFRGEGVAQTIARYQGGILISHGAWEGLDIKSYRFDAIIITKVPYPPPSEVLDMNFGEYQEWVIRKLKQAFGRGLRTADAICNFWILDKRFPLHGDVCAALGVSNRLLEHHLRLDLAIPQHLYDMGIFSEFGYSRARVVDAVNGQLVISN